MNNAFLFICLLGFYLNIFSQNDSISVKKLDEIILNTSRIDIPFSENSRSIQIISSNEIKKRNPKNVIELLKQISGIDIRQRGINGQQADLYIRGGTFDQSLILIDGVKLDDPQTGHHSLNLLLPIEMIERVEIIKGPASRIYGQNAFTGAINLVTKDILDSKTFLELNIGSFNQKMIKSSFSTKKLIANYSYSDSDGYRYNTDFINRSYLLKSNMKIFDKPVNFLGFFSERNFGANGFYATPSAKDQYEETQGSLISFTTKFLKNNFVFKPKIFWRRHQDEYVFIRNNPSIYRNLHISNKIGASIDLSYFSNIGTTGFGIDISNTNIISNNLGNHKRTISNLFLEHLFLLFNSKMDVILGTSFNLYSDYGNKFFPGIEIGYQINNSFKFFLNLANTYRIPTYTDLYYADSTTVGNENLNPESASNMEFGIKYSKKSLIFNGSLFRRNSKNLIDYVKEFEEDLWQARNILALETLGFELDFGINFKFIKTFHELNIGYTFIDDSDPKAIFNFSKYSINSFKNNYIFLITSKLSKRISSTINFKNSERSNYISYNVLDIGVKWQNSKWTFSILANNILNEEYYETNLIPMPKVNVNLSANYIF